MSDPRESGFKERTPLATARDRLLDAVTPHERTETVPLSTAAGRAVAERVTARRDVPGYERAAMDGFAVRAADTFDATERSPVVLDKPTEAGGEGATTGANRTVAQGEAIRVHTGSEVPAGADAVVKVEQTSVTDDGVEVYRSVTDGENVAPAGEDVERGALLFDPGHQLGPADVGLLKAVGVDEIETHAPPTVGVIPTGEELVQRDPAPGQVVETNGLTVSNYVERWGGTPAYRNVVTDDRSALRAAIQRDLTKDVVVTTGGSSVGERDLLPEIVDDLGTVDVHGVALKPGHPVGFGVVEETPVCMLPGYPVACVVTAHQFLRPALKRAGGLPRNQFPTTAATLDRKLPSEAGVVTFARVTIEGGDGEASVEPAETTGDVSTLPTATPTRTSGAGVLSSVSLADGWVAVPAEREGLPAGARVTVQHWEWHP